MDRLSELPDAVLTHTLSFLPTKDSIKTNLLSKRFENQWISVPNLIFHATNSTVQFVNKALVLWGGSKDSKVKKFDIECPSPCNDVHGWVHFAVERGVAHLRLVFRYSSCYNVDSYFTLPHHLYSNSSLQILELACCVVSPWTQVDWSGLKKLSITRLRLSNELIKTLICGSVQLELLEIFNCMGYDSLVISSSSLKILKIVDNFEYSATPVTISAPNIPKLCIGGVWHRMITFVCLAALVDAEVAFSYRSRLVGYNGEYISFIYQGNEYVEKVVEQLHCHNSVERLVIDTMFIEALTLAEVKTLPPQLSKCRSLTLCSKTEVNLLKGILNLEVLILDMEFSNKRYPNGYDVESFLMSEVEDCDFIFQHLKIVKITTHVDRSPSFPFIKFLLWHAKELETMSIFPKTASSYSIDYTFQVIQGLSAMPKSSPIAKVVLQKGQTKIQLETNSCKLCSK